MTERAGTARPRTRLALDRTALSAAALAVLLVKLGVEHGRRLEVLAGCAAAVCALLNAGRPGWLGGARRLQAIGASTALTAVLVLVDLLR